MYRTRTIISRSWLEAALEYKPYISLLHVWWGVVSNKRCSKNTKSNGNMYVNMGQTSFTLWFSWYIFILYRVPSLVFLDSRSCSRETRKYVRSQTLQKETTLVHSSIWPIFYRCLYPSCKKGMFSQSFSSRTTDTRGLDPSLILYGSNSNTNPKQMFGMWI